MASWGGSDNCDKDCLIWQENPDTNYDALGLQMVFDDTGKDPTHVRTVAYWDFSAATAVTSGNVTSAYIYLYLYSGVIPEEFLTAWYRITEAWNQGTITWNNQPDYSLTEYSAKNAPFAAGWVSWDVWTSGDSKSLIKDAIDNRSKILDVMLWTTDWEAALYQQANFYDREDISLNPYLIINYSVAGGASRNRGYVFGSKLGPHLPDPPRGWMRRRDLLLPVGC